LGELIECKVISKLFFQYLRNNPSNKRLNLLKNQFSNNDHNHLELSSEALMVLRQTIKEIKSLNTCQKQKVNNNQPLHNISSSDIASSLIAKLNSNLLINSQGSEKKNNALENKDKNKPN
jgi:hypothetical protein